MIRVGIIGSNYGRTVQLPAFRSHSRSEVVALAGSDPAKTAQIAAAAGIPYGLSWETLLSHPDVDAIAIAVPPALQPKIAIRALQLGKPVFAEKPLAADLAGARAMLDEAMRSGQQTLVDFNFSQIAVWRHAKTMLDAGAIGALRHVGVTWNVENAATRLRLRNWKTDGATGGGALGNFVSHSFHYLEWFCGPITGLSARLNAPPGSFPDTETTIALAMTFASGASGSLAMSCASFLGSGHRIELYGEDGTLMLINTTADYMRGFELLHVRRPAETLKPIPIDDPLDATFPDGRIAPVARLAGMFLEAIEAGRPASPGFAEGYRVQYLIDAARRSHELGQWLAIEAPRVAEAAH